MPHRKLARRFEPRYGVNQTMLDIESKWVGRELEDQLLQSTNELRQRLGEWQKLTDKAELELQKKFGALSDRERLAIRCMLARDCWHIAQLYLSFLGSAPLSNADAATIPLPEECDENHDPLPALPFKQTLFD